MTKGELIQVEWWDAFSIDPWMSYEVIEDAVKDPTLCHTVGYVVTDFETSISLCHTFNDDNKVCGVMQIPKCSIKDIKKL